MTSLEKINLKQPAGSPQQRRMPLPGSQNTGAPAQDGRDPESAVLSQQGASEPASRLRNKIKYRIQRNVRAIDNIHKGNEKDANRYNEAQKRKSGKEAEPAPKEKATEPGQEFSRSISTFSLNPARSFRFSASPEPEREEPKIPWQPKAPEKQPDFGSSAPGEGLRYPNTVFANEQLADAEKVSPKMENPRGDNWGASKGKEEPKTRKPSSSDMGGTPLDPVQAFKPQFDAPFVPTMDAPDTRRWTEAARWIDDAALALLDKPPAFMMSPSALSRASCTQVTSSPSILDWRNSVLIESFAASCPQSFSTSLNVAAP